MNIKIKIKDCEFTIENMTQTTLGYSNNDIILLIEKIIVNYNLINK